MPILTNQVMSLAASRPVYFFNKVGVDFLPVAELRRCLREMAYDLDRDDDRQGALYRSMFALISEIQVSPLNFDEQFCAKVEALFDGGVADEITWGRGVSERFARAKSIAYDLVGELNPLVIELIKSMRASVCSGHSFAVSCASRDRDIIRHIMEEAGLPAAPIVTSDADFSLLPVVDTMFRLGPLLSWGRGVAPAAILSAPRFCTLAQFVWAGTSDDSDFGDDPLNEFERGNDRLFSQVVTWEFKRHAVIVEWGKPILHPSSTVVHAPENDFEVFRRERGDLRAAVMIRIDNRLGVLWPPSSSVVSYTPGHGLDEQPVVMQAAGGLRPGQYLAYVKQVGDEECHSNQVTEERSTQWKSALSAALTCDADALKRRLELAGVRISSLAQRMRYWAEPPSTVIHAPQSEEHFRVLCNELGLNSTPAGGRIRDFWQLAWDDIRLSRGEAISAGVDRNEAFDRHLLLVLGQRLRESPQLQINGERVSLELPSIRDGEVMKLDLYQVQALEDGFRAPIAALKTIREIDYFQTQWHQ